jgi:amino acid transporter
MASRLLYGMAKQEVLPPFLGKVHPQRRTPWVAILFTTVLAFGLIFFVSRASTDATAVLGGTTALLLLGVFTIVNICVLVLRKDTVDSNHFVAPTVVPIIAGVCCAFLVTPFTGRDTEQYVVAGWLLVVGVVLWAITWFANRALRAKKTFLRDPESLSEREGGVN